MGFRYKQCISQSFGFYINSIFHITKIVHGTPYLDNPIWPGPPRVGKGFPRHRAKCRYISTASIMVPKEGRRPHKYPLRLQGPLTETETIFLFWFHFKLKGKKPIWRMTGATRVLLWATSARLRDFFSRCWPWNHGMHDPAKSHQTATHGRHVQPQG